MKPYGWLFDRKKRVECSTCQAARKQWYQVQTSQNIRYRRVRISESGVFPNVPPRALSLACNHCGNPPCSRACPAKAFKRRSDGLLSSINRDECQGCNMRLKFCPYAAPQFDTEFLLLLSRATNEIMARLFGATGAANLINFIINYIDICYRAGAVTMRWTVRSKTWLAGVEEPKYIISFGGDMVARTKIVNAPGVGKAKPRRAKLVVFNPEYFATAQLAGAWYPIRPSTHLAAALALINVILSQRLFDRQLVDHYTNFRDGEPQIRAHFSRFPPRMGGIRKPLPRQNHPSHRHRIRLHASRPCPRPQQNAHRRLHQLHPNGVRPGDPQHPRRPHRSPWRMLLRARFPFPPAPPSSRPQPVPPATGRRVDGRDRLPSRLFHQGVFATLAGGILNK